MIVTNNEVEKIRLLILECVKDWRERENKNTSSWVDDQLWIMTVNVMPDKICECDFIYHIHEVWIKAWNLTDKKIPMDNFLITWATNENIKKVIENV